MKDNRLSTVKSDNDIERIFTSYINSSLRGYAINYITKQTKQSQKEELRAEFNYEDVKISIIEKTNTDFFMLENQDYSFMIEMFENDSLSKIFKKLPLQTIQILFLKILGELTFKQISTKLNICQNSVENKYYRAIKRLKKEIIP